MSDKLNCTYQQAIYAVQDWLASGKKDERGRRNGLRCGQYVWNKYGKGGESWSELFYTEDYGTVSDILWKHFHPEA